MKRSILLGICLVSPVFAQALADYQWQKRVLVVTQASDELAATLTASKVGLVERDVEVLVLAGPVGCGKVPAAPLVAELHARLNVQADQPEVILLGKDSHTVLRWPVKKFTVAALFRSIDAMPMRKREIDGK